MTHRAPVARAMSWPWICSSLVRCAKIAASGTREPPNHGTGWSGSAPALARNMSSMWVRSWLASTWGSRSVNRFMTWSLSTLRVSTVVTGIWSSTTSHGYGSGMASGCASAVSHSAIDVTCATVSAIDQSLVAIVRGPDEPTRPAKRSPLSRRAARAAFHCSAVIARSTVIALTMVGRLVNCGGNRLSPRALAPGGTTDGRLRERHIQRSAGFRQPVNSGCISDVTIPGIDGVAIERQANEDVARAVGADPGPARDAGPHRRGTGSGPPGLPAGRAGIRRAGAADGVALPGPAGAGGAAGAGNGPAQMGTRPPEGAGGGGGERQRHGGGRPAAKAGLPGRPGAG